MGHLHPQLEIHADDFGLSEGVNAAILQLAENRPVLDAISVIKPVEAKRLRSLKDTRLGLHWAPYFRLGPLLRDRWIRRFPRAELAAHFDLQLKEYQEALGQAPAFVDSHMHVHQVPGLQNIFMERARAHGLPIERSTACVQALESSARLKRWILKRYGQSFRPSAATLILTLDYSRMRPEETADWIVQLLRNSSSAKFHLVVHPGLSEDSELKGRDGLWRFRDKDTQLVRALCRRL